MSHPDYLSASISMSVALIVITFMNSYINSLATELGKRTAKHLSNKGGAKKAKHQRTVSHKRIKETPDGRRETECRTVTEKLEY